MSNSNSENNNLKQKFPKRVLTGISIAILIVSAIILIIYAINVLLVIFAGILLSIFLRGIAKFVKRYINVSYNIAILIVIVAMLLIDAAIVFLMGPHIVDGFTQLSKQIPSAVEDFKNSLVTLPFGQQIVYSISHAPDGFFSDPNMAMKITGIFSTSLGAAMYLFVMLAVGLYLAFEENLYHHGFILLIPPQKRERADQVMKALGRALGWWMVGRFSSMMVVGVLTYIGLLILGIPLAFTLALIAAHCLPLSLISVLLFQQFPRF